MSCFIRQTFTLIGVVTFASGMLVAQQSNSAHTHIGHVTESFNDTLKQQGLLPTALAEARVAAHHAALMLKELENLEHLKAHSAHVLHAIDPTLTENKGPGLGYGLKKAAAAAAFHIQLAAKAADSSANVKTHEAHVSASITNVIRRADEIIELGQRIRAASSASEAARHAAQIKTLSDAIVSGADANKDGRVTWELGEGGLEQARQHMDLMKKGEKSGLVHE